MSILSYLPIGETIVVFVNRSFGSIYSTCFVNRPVASTLSGSFLVADVLADLRIPI